MVGKFGVINHLGAVSELRSTGRIMQRPVHVRLLVVCLGHQFESLHNHEDIVTDIMTNCCRQFFPLGSDNSASTAPFSSF